jgi:uncharacterized membrane protein
MQFLPSGLVVPPLPYLAVLAVLSVLVASLLYVVRPPVTQYQVLAFTPWMVSGGILHVLKQIGAFPDLWAPFFAAPAVYVTVFVLGGSVWVGSSFLAEMRNDASRIARDVGGVGLGVVTALAGVAYWQALGLIDGTFPLVWPVIGFLGALVVFAPAYYLLTLWKTGPVGHAGIAGAVAVYAHVLDGVSTAIGVDLLGSGERSPLPREIMKFAADLPTEPYLGTGWLFVVVKLVVASGIVLLLADYVEEEPDEGNLLLAFVTAFGLGPASNNLFLFLMDLPV